MTNQSLLKVTIVIVSDNVRVSKTDHYHTAHHLTQRTRQGRAVSSYDAIRYDYLRVPKS